MTHRHAIKSLIEARTKEQTSEYWIQRLNEYGVPCGPVLNMREVFDDPQVINQEMTMDVPHPGHGTVRMLGYPIKFSDAPFREKRPGTWLGPDTDEVPQHR